MSAVQPQYGPTLLQLLAARPRRVRIAAGVFAALLALAAIVIALRSRPTDTFVLVREPITFNFEHGIKLKPITRPGALAALRRPRTGTFLESYVIRELLLPPYEGSVGGMLPLYFNDYMRTLRKRYPGADLINEGRARLNNGIGYQGTLRGERDGRTLYVRHFLIVPEQPDGERDGVVIELESTYAAGTPNAESTGAIGPLRQALRTFHFGEDPKAGPKAVG